MEIVSVYKTEIHFKLQAIKEIQDQLDGETQILQKGQKNIREDWNTQHGYATQMQHAK